MRLRSDATRLPTEGPCILVHVLSPALTWGLGFTQAIEGRWPEIGARIQTRLRDLRPRPALGDVLWTEVDARILLGHLVVERADLDPVRGSLDQRALVRALTYVAERAIVSRAAVHMPPLGTGLTGASWSDVLAHVEVCLVTRGVPVVVHCLGGSLPR